MTKALNAGIGGAGKTIICNFLQKQGHAGDSQPTPESVFQVKHHLIQSLSISEATALGTRHGRLHGWR